MANEHPMSWTKEPHANFLNNHELYRGVKSFLWKSWASLDEIEPNFFTEKQAIGGLSVDWSKHAKPEDTLNRLQPPSLDIWGIIKLNIGKLKVTIIEKELPIEIEHDPIPSNPSHTLLLNINKGNKAKIRRELSKIAEWVNGMNPNEKYKF